MDSDGGSQLSASDLDKLRLLSDDTLESTVGSGISKLFGQLGNSFMNRLAEIGPSGKRSVRLSILSSTGAEEGRWTLADSRAYGSDEGGNDLGCIRCEGLSDLIAIESGERLIMSLLRSGRVSVDTEDEALRLQIASLPASPLDRSPAPREVTSAPLWVPRSSDRQLERKLRELGLAPFLLHYARTQAEAIFVSGAIQDLGGLGWQFETRDSLGTRAWLEVDSSGPRWSVSGGELETTVTVSWLSSLDFVRYLGRQLDFRDAILSGKCSLSGDTTLAAQVYRRINRHGL